MTDGITEYRRFAKNCLNLSRIYQAPSHRALLMEMAEAWLMLARQAEPPDTLERSPYRQSRATKSSA